MWSVKALCFWRHVSRLYNTINNIYNQGLVHKAKDYKLNTIQIVTKLKLFTFIQGHIRITIRKLRNAAERLLSYSTIQTITVAYGHHDILTFPWHTSATSERLLL